MAIKNWNYSTTSEYTYDAASIEVTGGAAKLFYRPFLASEIYACWHLNESSGVTTAESVNGRDGLLINGPTWVAGKLNNCLLLGMTKYVNCGTICRF